MKLRQIFIVILLIGTGTLGYCYTNPAPEPSQTPPANQESNQAEPEPNQPSPENEASSSTSREADESEPTSEPTEPASESEEYESRRARVLRAYDGDSLKVLFLDNRETAEIRLMGIDCPETSEEVDKCGPGGLVDLPCEEQIPLGIRAKSYAKTLLEGEVVTLESYNDFDRGNYGRVLAYVRTPDGEDYGLKTIKKGYCNDSGRIYDHPRDEKYERYQRPLRR